MRQSSHSSLHCPSRLSSRTAITLSLCSALYIGCGGNEPSSTGGIGGSTSLVPPSGTTPGGGGQSPAGVGLGGATTEANGGATGLGTESPSVVGGAASTGTPADSTGAIGGSTSNGGATSTGGAASVGSTGPKPGFYVDGRFLYDKCGEKVLLRGVSEMVVWSGTKNGNPFFAEIAKTGANVVRIVWTAKDGTAAQLDKAIANAIANQLIPMPELHDATGDITLLPGCVDYWVSSDVVSVIKKYEDKLLINIANEVGASVPKAAWTEAYKLAITRMRAAGIHVPLIIDAPQWGQDINMLQAAGPTLITEDPDHNLLFSVHMWWNDANGTRVTTEIGESVKMNLPLIVGEFAQHSVSGCSAAPFDYKTLMSLAKTEEIGYLAWSWGGVANSDCKTDGPFDMTTDGTFAGLNGWGLEVATTDPNSIQNTSVRPNYIVSGTCK